MDRLPKIGIVYLLFYHNQSYVDDMVSALKKITYPKERIELIIVSNPHPEEGDFLDYIQEVVMPFSEKELPNVTVLPQDENTGFAKGNNVGAAWALEHNCSYVFFHNNDGFLATNGLEPLVALFEKDQTVGAAQSLILLHPDTDYINSSGNCFHYLGFGYCDNYRSKREEITLPSVKEIGYASGAALMVRADLIKKYGGWDEDFFLYHEDLEWSLRLRMVGLRVVLVKDSVFYHKYKFSRSIEKYFWMERNRYGLMLMFFRWPTLLLFLPFALFLELGLLFFAIKGGWARERWKVYRYWFSLKHLVLWLGKRKKIQKIRTVSDREILAMAVTGIHFQDTSTDSMIIRHFANPLFGVYYRCVVRCLVWW